MNIGSRKEWKYHYVKYDFVLIYILKEPTPKKSINFIKLQKYKIKRYEGWD